MKRLLTHGTGYRAGALLVWVLLLPALARESSHTHLDSLLDDKQYESALKEIHQALEKASKDESITLHLYEGGILFKQNSKNEGCAAFLKALTQQPNAVLPLKLRPEFQQRLDALRPELKIRQLRESIQYDSAIKEASLVLEKNQDGDEEERLLLYKAILLYENHEKEEGLKIFGDVLNRHRDAQLPVEDVSPKIRDDFERTRPPPPPGPRHYAWIPAVVGGTLAAAGAVALNEDRINHNRDGKAEPTLGIGLLCGGAASIITAVIMYNLHPDPSNHASISVGLNGKSAFVSVRW